MSITSGSSPGLTSAGQILEECFLFKMTTWLFPLMMLIVQNEIFFGQIRYCHSSNKKDDLFENSVQCAKRIEF
jgi:hypothetical protein